MPPTKTVKNPGPYWLGEKPARAQLNRVPLREVRLPVPKANNRLVRLSDENVPTLQIYDAIRNAGNIGGSLIPRTPPAKSKTVADMAADRDNARATYETTMREFYKTTQQTDRLMMSMPVANVSLENPAMKAARAHLQAEIREDLECAQLRSLNYLPKVKDLGVTKPRVDPRLDVFSLKMQWMVVEYGRSEMQHWLRDKKNFPKN